MVLPRPPHRPCPRTVAKGCRGGALLQPHCAILKRPSRRAQPVGGIWSGPLCAWTDPCVSGLAARRVTPSSCHKLRSPSRPSEAPAFLAKPGSSTHVRECGCDAASTGRLSPAAPGCLQLGPALLPEPAGTLEERSGAGGGKGEVAAEQGAERCGSTGTPISCTAHPLAKGTELACSEGTGEQKRTRGGFVEARSVFPKCVCVCAQVRAYPAPERCLLRRSCLLWPLSGGLSPG